MILVEIRVVTNAKKSELIPLDGNSFRARLKSKPVDNQANEELIDLLALHYRVAKSRVVIKKGLTSRQKLIRID